MRVLLFRHGCSAAAVRHGRCIDTTMGFTPLDGLMMATGSGAMLREVMQVVGTPGPAGAPR